MCNLPSNPFIHFHHPITFDSFASKKISAKSSLNTLGKKPNNPTPVSRIQCQHIVLHSSITALNTINLDISRATLLGRFAHRLQDLAVLVPGVKGGCIKGRDLPRDIVVGRDQGGEVI